MGTFLPSKTYLPAFFKSKEYTAKSAGSFYGSKALYPLFMQGRTYAAKAGGVFSDGTLFSPDFFQSKSYSAQHSGVFFIGKKMQLYGVETQDVATVTVHDFDPLTHAPRVRTFYKSRLIRKGQIFDFTVDKRFGFEPLSCQFTDLCTPKSTSWYWNFGDGNTSTERNPFHVYPHYGYYNVSLTVRIEGAYHTIRKTI